MMNMDRKVSKTEVHQAELEDSGTFSVSSEGEEDNKIWVPERLSQSLLKLKSHWPKSITDA